MYNCYNLKKFLVLIVCDFLIIGFLCLIFHMRSDDINADRPKEGIFVPVAMYHSILENTSQSQEFIVTPQTLENDLKYLKENGFETVQPRDLIAYIDYGEPLPEKPVMLTFDDGNYNNMYYLLPLLEKYDMQAVISIVGEFTEFFSNNGEEHIKKYSYLTWDDIDILEKSGRIEIANHTYDLHSSKDRKGCSKLSYESKKDYTKMLTEDLSKLQNTLALKADCIPRTFAYPFGYISKESVPVLKSLGFRVTLSCYERPNYITKNDDSLFELGRYNRPNNITTELYMAKLLKR